MSKATKVLEFIGLGSSVGWMIYLTFTWISSILVFGRVYIAWVEPLPAIFIGEALLMLLGSVSIVRAFRRFLREV